MWNDWFSIGKFTVHGYGVCIAVGILMALWLVCARAKQRGMSEDICYGITFCGAIFGFIGAKVMFLIVEWKDLIADPMAALSSSGFVVYGGITGGVLAVIIYCKIKKVDVIDYLELSFPSVALGQAFGRLGCFMAGCCYGKQTDSFIGVTFTHSDFAPNHVKLYPTQLMSSLGDLLNMALLLLIASKTKKKGVITGAYLAFYSVGRFVIEMFRGDEERGMVGALSTSQFYGIFTFVLGAAIIVFAFTRKPKEVEE